MRVGVAGVILVGSAAGSVVGLNPAACLVIAMLAWLAALANASGASVRLVLGVALCARAPFAMSDFLTDDLHRYVWEGRVVNAGFDPYVLAPDAPELVALRDESHARINHPTYRSVYPPVAQAVFAGVTAAGGREVAMRNVFLAVDWIVVAVLIAWRRALGRSVGLALAYAWCPIAVLSAGSGHLDPLALVFVAGAGWALARGRGIPAGVCLGLASLSKVFPVLLLPWVLGRGSWRAGIAFAGVVAASLAFVPLPNLVAPLQAFAYDFSFNAPLFVAIRDHLPGTAHDWVRAGLVLWLGLTLWVEPRFANGAVLAIGGLLALSPTVHFWYFSWILLPAAACLPSGIAWIAVAWCGAVVAHYSTYADAYVGREFLEDHGATHFTAFVPLAVGSAMLVRAWLRRRRPDPPSAIEWSGGRVAVIVPAFAEAQNLGTLLPMWKSAGADLVIVADTPTGDGTRELTDGVPGTEYVAVARRGYGAAVLAGLEAARAASVEIAIVADADDHAAPGHLTALLAPFDRAEVGLVTGARGRASRLGLVQRGGNAFVTALIALRFGRWFQDLGPLRALRMSAWPDGSIEDHGYGINVEMNVGAVLRGIEVVEIALDAGTRLHGKNRISRTLAGAARAGHGMLSRLRLMGASS